MKISCNILKKHLKNSENIDFLNIWETFTIRTAEVENVTPVGDNLQKVVVAEIIEYKKHPEKDKYNLLKVSDGKTVYNVLCGAPNCRQGLKIAFVTPGGTVQGITINEKEIAGFLSQGMCCSIQELGIGDNHDGILELPTDAPLGMDITEYLPIKDIIVEIDNKSLTNRPDLWGHYGIAREIAAITGHELLPLELAVIPSNLKEIDIKIKAQDICSRFCGLKIENITVKHAPLDIQIFLHYIGMRSISLLVDLSNYIMLELGQPNHTYDARKVKSIQVVKAQNEEKFITLDNVERELTKEMLMIKNEKEYIGIAGVMGGLASEIENDTENILIEAATFDSATVRKTAIKLGLRTEASTRFEKSLDPNMADIAIKRFAYLLETVDSNIKYASNLTDIYPQVLKEPKIDLPKDKLFIYLGSKLTDDKVIKILDSLEMKTKAYKDKYTVTVPTFRATKDISIAEDIIEEIVRIYGLENIETTPLKLDLTFSEHENIIENEHEIKNFLTTKYDLHEVHTYLWPKTNFLNKLNIELNNPSLEGKTKDNILRNDLCLSLLEVASENLKYHNNFGIYEIGTVITNNTNKRILSILLVDEDSSAQKTYLKAKDIIYKIYKTFKNIEIIFTKSTDLDYYNNDLTYSFSYNNIFLGTIKVFNNKVTNIINKKKIFVTIEIDFEELINIPKQIKLYEDISKYPTVQLDYTIIMTKELKYANLEHILTNFKSPLIQNFSLIDTYEGDKENKYTIRYIIGSFDKTLENNELNSFKETFINYIKDNNLTIIE